MKSTYSEIDRNEFDHKSFNGVYEEIANLLGIDAALEIYETYRGQQITFPVYLFNKEFISKKIIAEYDGQNAKQLASKYGYSEKWIRKILKDKGE